MAAVIDLRSDTVTKPTREMREAMASAEVGDDVYGDDPTVNRLQTLTAEMFGKEAALFVPSGTMGNLISVLTWCDTRDSEMILGCESHIHVYEQGGSATLGGVHSRALPTETDGTIALERIEAAIRTDDAHFPVTKLVCLENTHNRTGGRALPLDYIDAVGALCAQRGLRFHMDGARIFNAAVATGVDVRRICRTADSVSVCLSKGLGAPVGSLVVGPTEFIRKARRLRKALGGGMRQAGVLAACGIISLTTMVSRLQEDHDNARTLARGVNSLSVSGLSVDESAVQTNMLKLTVEESRLGMSTKALLTKLNEKGVLANQTSASQIRLVTHNDVTTDHVGKFLDILKRIVTP